MLKQNFLHLLCALAVFVFFLFFSRAVTAAPQNSHNNSNQNDYKKDTHKINQKDYHYDKKKDYHPRWTYKLPGTSVMISIGGRDYYYSEGFFFIRESAGYAVANPPVNTVVPSLPQGTKIVTVHGYMYYCYNNIYFLRYYNDYIVVENPFIVPPPVYVTPPVIVLQPDYHENTEQNNPLMVYVPNANGSYTRVILTKSGTGYLGPQNEYYRNFPTIKQLIPMYAK